MDEIERTLDSYESDAAAYVEKYLSESALELFGDPFVDALEGGRVLDLGCGPGSDTDVLASRGFDVVGLDVTAPFLRAAAERRTESPDEDDGDAAFVQGDMRSLPFAAQTFDGIWGSASFHHVPREQASDAVAELRRVLREGGRLFLSVKRAPTGSETGDRHFEFYETAAFRAFLADAGLEPETVETTGDWVSAIAREEG